MASGRVFCWSQHLWQPSAPLTTTPPPRPPHSFPLFWFPFCVFIYVFIHSSLPSRTAQVRVWRVTQKKWNFDANRSLSSASAHLHHRHISCSQGCEVIGTSGSYTMFSKVSGKHLFIDPATFSVPDNTGKAERLFWADINVDRPWVWCSWPAVSNVYV